MTDNGASGAQPARVGTFVVELPGLSRLEGTPCSVLMRRLRGSQYSEYLREQRRLTAGLRQLVRTRQAEAAKAPADAATADMMIEVPLEEEQATYKIIDTMRAFLRHSLLRVFIGPPEARTEYTPTEKAIGEHDPQEISVDAIEPDFGHLINQLLIKSGLINNEESFRPQPGDAGGAGPGGETVRPAAEPVGEGAVGGPAV